MGITTTMTMNVPRIRVYVSNMLIFFLIFGYTSSFEYTSLASNECCYNLDAILL